MEKSRLYNALTPVTQLLKKTSHTISTLLLSVWYNNRVRFRWINIYKEAVYLWFYWFQSFKASWLKNDYTSKHGDCSWIMNFIIIFFLTKPCCIFSIQLKFLSKIKSFSKSLQRRNPHVQNCFPWEIICISRWVVFFW